MNRFNIKQLCRPERKLTVVENHINDEGQKEHFGYVVDFFAVCEDGQIRPVVINGGIIEVFDPVEISGIYTDQEVRDMLKRCKHRFTIVN